MSLRTLTLPADRAGEQAELVASLTDAATQLPGLRSSWVAPVLIGVGLNAGHVVWRATFTTEADAHAAPLDPAWRSRIAPLLDGCGVTGVGYRVTRAGVRPAGAGVWRALVFRVVPQGFPHVAAQLEEGLMLMPRHVSTIRSWALSRVASVEGAKAYTTCGSRRSTPWKG